MTVRLAGLGDIEAVCRLYDEFYSYNSSQQPCFYVAAKEGGQYPRSVVEGEKGDIFVAEIEGAPVGFIHVDEEETPPYPSVARHRFAYIMDLYVKPGYRKRGIGKVLLEKAKEWALSRKLEYLELFVLEENIIGRSFYKRESFATASRTMRYML